MIDSYCKPTLKTYLTLSELVLLLPMLRDFLKVKGNLHDRCVLLSRPLQTSPPLLKYVTLSGNRDSTLITGREGFTEGCFIYGGRDLF